MKHVVLVVWVWAVPTAALAAAPADPQSGFFVPNSEAFASIEPVNALHGIEVHSAEQRYELAFTIFRSEGGLTITPDAAPEAFRAAYAAVANNLRSGWATCGGGAEQNTSLMQSAQNLINAAVAGDEVALVEAPWDIVEAALALTLYRVELVSDRYDPSGTTVPTTFFDQFRDAPAVVPNPLLPNPPEDVDLSTCADGVPAFVFANERILATRAPSRTFTPEKHALLVQSILPGLDNPDARVRITAVHLLRRLGPSPDMWNVVSAHLAEYRHEAGSDPSEKTILYLNTNHFSRNSSRDYDAPVLVQLLTGVLPGSRLVDPSRVSRSDPAIVRLHFIEREFSSSTEFDPVFYLPSGIKVRTSGYLMSGILDLDIHRLQRFIRRSMDILSVKDRDSSAVALWTREDFGVLSKQIDNEHPIHIPFQSLLAAQTSDGATPAPMVVFDAADVEFLAGIDIPKDAESAGIWMEFIIGFYNFYSGIATEHPVKQAIEGAVRRALDAGNVVDERTLEADFILGARIPIFSGTPLSRDLPLPHDRSGVGRPESVMTQIRTRLIAEYVGSHDMYNPQMFGPYRS